MTDSPATYTAEEVQRAVMSAVQAHRGSHWSDGTWGCGSCAKRYEQETPREDFDLAFYGRLAGPGWTRAEFDEHLTAAVTAELTATRDAEPAAAPAAEPDAPSRGPSSE